MILNSASYVVGPGLMFVLWSVVSSSGERSRQGHGAAHAVPVIGTATHAVEGTRCGAMASAAVDQTTSVTDPGREYLLYESVKWTVLTDPETVARKPWIPTSSPCIGCILPTVVS